MAKITKPEWLIVLFIHEIGEYRNIIKSTLDELEKDGIGINTELYLLMDAVDAKDCDITPLPDFVLTIKRMERDEDGNPVFMPVEDIPFDNTNRKCWAVGLEGIFKRVSAKRNMLITLSHGAAFGINVDATMTNRPQRKDPQTGCFKPMDVMTFDQFQTNSNFYFDQLESTNIRNWSKQFLNKDIEALGTGRVPKEAARFKCEKMECLWITDIANALKELPGNPVIDIMIMVNCYMQTFDTGYILRDRVKYLIAAQTGIPANGFNISKIAHTLAAPGAKQLRINSKPAFSITTTDVVQKAIDIFFEKFKNTDTHKRITITANRLNVYRDLIKLFMQVIQILEIELLSNTTQSQNTRATLVMIREEHIKYVSISHVNNSNKLMMIDARLWLSLLFTHLPHLFNKTALPKKFTWIFNHLLLAKHIGSSLKKEDETFKQKYGMNGLSIFFPTKKDYLQLERFTWCAYFSSDIPSAFKRDSRWNRFLKLYYNIP